MRLQEIRRLKRAVLTTVVLSALAVPPQARADRGSSHAGGSQAAPSHTKVVVPQDMQARFYATAVRVKDRMLGDYKTLLQVYYELKRSSRTPNEFPNPDYNAELAKDFAGDVGQTFSRRTLPRAEEFDIGMYQEFSAALDRDPRLKGNTYVVRMKELGIGRANDVFQRMHAYSLEEFAKYEPIDVDLTKRLRIDIASDIRDLAIYEASGVFNEASQASGYAANKAALDLADEPKWRAPVEAKARQLEHELKKIGFAASPTRSHEANCAMAFSTLVK